MIDRLTIVPELARAIPGFKARWEHYETQPDYEPEPYIDVYELSNFVLDELAQGNVAPLTSLSEALERLYARIAAEPDDLARSILTDGFLEALIEDAPARAIPLGRIHDALGPHGSEEWSKAYEYKNRGKPWSDADA